MTIPNSTNYPNEIDTDINLFLVHDGLRLRLAEDYTPGDTFIQAEGDVLIMSRFPATGIITLTEQCSEIELRAISFHYNSIDYQNFRFEDIEILPEFTDNFKPKRITNITLNVVSKHHNHIKDALIAIENFLGVKGTIDNVPNGPTIEGRTNFLRKIVLRPRAWFTADKVIGLVPLEVTFIDQSFRLGTDGTGGEIKLIWDFGDNTASVITSITASEIVPPISNIIVQDVDGGTIKKTYFKPGKYDVTLIAQNQFGEDICKFQKYINARIEAPEPAVIDFIASSTNQLVTAGSPIGGPYTTPPNIRTPINTLITFMVPSGENIATPGVAYSGELIGMGDPVTNYTWLLGDDLLHSNSNETKATYSVGGFYDLKLRVDTEAGAYRITTYENSIDVVEKTNLWFWSFTNFLAPNEVTAYEYGLISETFKIANAPSWTLTRNESFLDNVPNEDQQKKEFRKNVYVSHVGSLSSGQNGVVKVFYAGGREETDPLNFEEVKVFEFNGFSGTYLNQLNTPSEKIVRPWNWVALSNDIEVNFLLGYPTTTIEPNTSPTNPSKVKLNLSDMSNSNDSVFGNTLSNFKNGAEELKQNPAQYDSGGNSIYGHFSVYRTTWKDNSGYILRNSAVGDFLRLRNFYRTEGTVGTPVMALRKLEDLSQLKIEGSLTAMSGGIYLFNNSGSISLFNTVSSKWQSGGPGINSIAYRGLQDTTVDGFDDSDQELFVASDRDKRTYITYKYSEKVFLKFNEVSFAFSTLGTRPVGTPWVMEVY
jgi:PKD repeat protein